MDSLPLVIAMPPPGHMTGGLFYARQGKCTLAAAAWSTSGISCRYIRCVRICECLSIRCSTSSPIDQPSFASLSEGWSIGELVLQRILRHSQIRTQRMYRHEMPEVLQAA